MGHRLDEIKGEDAELMKRLGGAVLAIWSELPKKVRNNIVSQSCMLRGPMGENPVQKMVYFTERFDGEVE